jgi:hypothetical protein
LEEENLRAAALADTAAATEDSGSRRDFDKIGVIGMLAVVLAIPVLTFILVWLG